MATMPMVFGSFDSHLADFRFLFSFTFFQAN